jgi:hypothetical protein
MDCSISSLNASGSARIGPFRYGLRVARNLGMRGADVKRRERRVVSQPDFFFRLRAELAQRAWSWRQSLRLRRNWERSPCQFQRGQSWLGLFFRPRISQRVSAFMKGSGSGSCLMLMSQSLKSGEQLHSYELLSEGICRKLHDAADGRRPRLLVDAYRGARSGRRFRRQEPAAAGDATLGAAGSFCLRPLGCPLARRRTT